MKLSWIAWFAVCLAPVACGDDVSSGGGTDGGSSSTSGSGASSSGSTSDVGTTGSGTGTGTGTGTLAGTGTGTGTEGDTGTGTGTESGTTGTDGSSSSSSGDGTTGGVATVCDEGGEFVLLWGLQVPGGIFPDDIPTDLIETCTFTPSMIAGELPIACPELDLLFTIESTPMAELPDAAQDVDVRLHRAPGPLGFPDFWVDLQFADGPRISLVNSSVFVPPNATVELPFDMSVSDEECGPFNVGTPFQPEDPCGEQMWLGIDLALDVPYTVFHGTHAEGVADGDDVNVWVGTARDYGVLPQFCDFSAIFFSTMVIAG